MKSYSSYLTDIPRIIGNSDSDSVTWAMETINDSLRYLTTKFYFNERTYTFPGGTVAQQQFYNLPPQVKKLINVTITIGAVKWQPKECPSREYWDNLNTITFYQDFPSFFFVYNGQVGIFPIPASSSNTLTMNYKTRIRDLSIADYTTGTVSVTTNTATITGSGTAWYSDMAGRWIKITPSSSNTTSGDGQWYQIDSVTNATTIVLKNNYIGSTVSGGAYIIGEMPILPEDYHDLPLYRMGYIYYTTRLPDATRAQLYQDLYQKGYTALNDEFGSKTTNVVLTDTDYPIANPNLFSGTITGH